MEFSEALIKNLKDRGMWNGTVSYLRSKFFFKTVIRYALNWKYRSTRKDLVEWLNNNSQLPNKVKSELRDMRNIQDQDSKMRQILYYVNKNISYEPDQERWKVPEYWQTAIETWRYLGGDCEDGAILIYLIAVWLGIPDTDIFIAAGDVVGGGHAYVVYQSQKDGLEYPIDWCYWFDQSKLMKTPYYLRSEYYGGNREWFRFNLSGGYKLK